MPSYRLVMRTGPHPDKIFDLVQPAIIIGRDTVNDIVINDPEISRRHARLTLQTGEYLLEDMGSTNGTFVNGQRLIGPHLLRAGELILLGENVSVVFEKLQYDPDATVVVPADMAPFPTGGMETYVMPTYQPDQYNFPPPTPAETPAYIPPSIERPSSDAYYGIVIPNSPEIEQAAADPFPVGNPQYDRFAPETEAALDNQVDYYPPDQGKKLSMNWILGGVGCLLVFILVCVGAAYVFDSLSLYCVPPFEKLLGSWLYPCTP